MLILIIVAVLPAAGIITYNNYERQRHDIDMAKDEAMIMLQGLARDHENVTEVSRRFLMTLARLPSVRKRDSAACTSLFRELLKDNSLYTVIIAADIEGRVFTNALPSGNVSIKKRKYFQDAVQQKAFSAGEYTIGAISGRAILPFAYPVTDEFGHVTGVVVIGLDLEKYGKNFVTTKNLPKGSTLNLLDQNFLRLYRYPDNETYAGKTDLYDIVKQMSSGSNEGVFTSRGVDGVKRIFAYKRFYMRDTSSPYMYMRIGIPEEGILVRAKKIFIRSMVLLVLFMVIAILSAWLLGHLLIVQMLNRLVHVSGQLGKGDLAVRTGIDYRSGELGLLARSFDEMGESLEIKELARRVTEEALIESESKFKSFAEQALVGTYLIQDGVFKYVNPKFAMMFGYTVEECLDNMNFEKLVYTGDLELVREQVRRRIAGEVESVHYTFRGIKKDGQLFDVEIYGSSSIHRGRPAAAGTILDITDRKHSEEEREKLIAELQQALSEVKTLSGLLPICASCKKIRDDSGYWNQIESYVSAHSNAKFSHGLCPDCLKKYYPDTYEKLKSDGKI